MDSLVNDTHSGVVPAVNVDNVTTTFDIPAETPSTAGPTSATNLLPANNTGLHAFSPDSNTPIQQTGNENSGKDGKAGTLVVETSQMAKGNMGALEDAEVPMTNPSSYRFLFPFNLTFEFITPMIVKGFFKALVMRDVWALKPEDRAETLLEKYNKAWAKNKHRKMAVLASLNAVIGWSFWFGAVLRLLADMLTLVNPFLTSFLLNYLADPNAPIWSGYFWCLVVFVIQVLVAFVNAHQFDIMARTGMRARSILVAQIYQKAANLSNQARLKRTVGEVTNMMSIDTQKINDAAQFIHYGWSSLVIIVVCLGFLFGLLQLAVFAGIGVMILLFPVQAFVIRTFAKYRALTLKQTDHRIKAMNEILNGIRIIKFFSWEDSYKKKIFAVRGKELNMLVRTSVARALLGSLISGSPILIAVATFIIYSIIPGNSLNPAIIFPALSYLNLLRFPLNLAPLVISFAVEALVSLNRMNGLFNEEEVEPPKRYENYDVPVVLRSCNFEWEKAPEKPAARGRPNPFARLRKKKQVADANQIEMKETSPTSPIDSTSITVVPEGETKEEEKKEVGRLNNIDFEVKKGSLTMIVGTVGSGKSSVFSGMLGEMKQTSGSVEVSGTIAYCSQSAWIMNDTVKGNIVFGRPYSEQRYQETIKYAALTRDLEILPAGDKTEIGEKGINLSGGQRQRVSIARAVYRDADIYLLDDVLSAVDAHVGRYLFEQCINGYLKQKTRILVTHQLQYLPYADHILVMDNGTIAERGNYQELMQIENGIVSNLFRDYMAKESHEEEGEEKEKAPAKKKQATSREGEAEQEEDKKEEDGQLMQLEERNKGSLSLRLIFTYIYLMGVLPAFIVLGLYAIAEFGIVASDWFLSQWTSNTFPNLSSGAYLGIYAAIGVSSALIVFFRELGFSLFTLLASARMHTRVFNRVIRAPMSFFDTTPIGRIISRFSKDQENMDSVLIFVLAQFLSSFSQVIGAVVVMIYGTYWFAIPLVPITIIYIVVFLFYRATSRELKRLDNISRSPLYSHFAESLYGLTTIRAYDRMDDFIHENMRKLDLNQRPYYAFIISQRWLGIRLDILSALMVLCVTVFSCAMKGLIPVGVSGLTFTYALQITNALSFAVRQSTEAEANFTAVERMDYYARNVPNEAKAIVPDNRPPENWPSQGVVKFDNFCMRYRPGLPLVLNGLTLESRPMEAIGIVGRTGAGKSSIMLTLYRLVEAASGKIEIDGIDIASIGLQDLRTKLSIIPQEPTLFSGTIKSNLDPFGNCDDATLLENLKKAHLGDLIQALPKKLDSEVAEGGSNFSVGQRQLICLARALCIKTKVLILDEATASVDIETDALIQKTVREYFKDATRLTIAHRLNTIIDYDRILVMDKGKIGEFDTPANLLRKRTSIFYSMLQETGKSNVRAMYKIVFGEEDAADIVANAETEEISIEEIKEKLAAIAQNRAQVSLDSVAEQQSTVDQNSALLSDSPSENANDPNLL